MSSTSSTTPTITVEHLHTAQGMADGVILATSVEVTVVRRQFVIAYPPIDSFVTITPRSIMQWVGESLNCDKGDDYGPHKHGECVAEAYQLAAAALSEQVKLSL